MDSFEEFFQKCSNDDLGMILTVVFGKVKFSFPAFIWEEFIELVEDLGEKNYKYS